MLLTSSCLLQCYMYSVYVHVSTNAYTYSRPMCIGKTNDVFIEYTLRIGSYDGQTSRGGNGAWLGY